MGGRASSKCPRSFESAARSVSPVGRNKNGRFGQLPINRWLERTTLPCFAYRAHIRSAHARLRELTWLREIFLVAQPPLLCPFAKVCQRGEICPHEIIANWTLNSIVVHYPKSLDGDTSREETTRPASVNRDGQDGRLKPGAPRDVASWLHYGPAA